MGEGAWEVEKDMEQLVMEDPMDLIHSNPYFPFGTLRNYVVEERYIEEFCTIEEL